jgi:hypothetical protein
MTVHMTAYQYKIALNRLNLSNAESAKALGISLASHKRYRVGSHPIPETVAKLLRAMVRLETIDV